MKKQFLERSESHSVTTTDELALDGDERMALCLPLALPRPRISGGPARSKSSL